MKYKNCGYSTRTFYGIDLAPGEIKDFPGYIKSFGIIRVFEGKNPKESVVAELKTEEIAKAAEKPKRKYTKRTTKPSINKTTQSSKPSSDDEVKSENENSEEK